MAANSSPTASAISIEPSCGWKPMLHEEVFSNSRPTFSYASFRTVDPPQPALTWWAHCLTVLARRHLGIKLELEGLDEALDH
jgi:hypothetical protein